QQTIDPATKNIEKSYLALNNEISKMRTESEWKSETQTLGVTLKGHGTYVPDNLSYDASELTHSRIYTNESNITGCTSITSHRSEYPDKTEATWVEFTSSMKEEKEKGVPPLQYKIKAWVDKEGKKKDKFVSSSGSRNKNNCGASALAHNLIITSTE
ncbi:11305_t:CDS:2, partial [Entrophospora sp. SA101]